MRRTRGEMYPPVKPKLQSFQDQGKEKDLRVRRDLLREIFFFFARRPLEEEEEEDEKQNCQRMEEAKRSHQKCMRVGGRGLTFLLVHELYIHEDTTDN
jgi:hypothetical protein